MDLAFELANRAAPLMAGGALARLLDVVIEGHSKVPGAKSAAAAELAAKADAEAAISSLVTKHVAMAGSQGFLTNVGGFVTALVAVPANIVGTLTIQCRMVAAIAHLRGYDLGDNRVRSAVLMCLLGRRRTEKLVRRGELPSTPHAVATAPAFDEQLDDKVSALILNGATTSMTGKRISVWLTRGIPVVSGGVGAVVDARATGDIAEHARAQFPSRRARPRTATGGA